VDATKGVIRVVGDREYRIDVRYSHRHDITECAVCGYVLQSRKGTEIYGVMELGKALSTLAEYYAWDIRNGENHSVHLLRISLDVIDVVRNELMESYEITAR
jgi:hypothetical protein